MTEVAFKPLSAVEKVVYDILWTPMLKAGELWIEGAVPFLALPIVKQVDEAVLKLLTDALFHQLVLFIDVQAIRLVNAEHQKLYDSASLKLKIVLLESGADSDAYLQARDAALLAQSRLTNIAAGQS